MYAFETPERRAQIPLEDYLPWIEQSYPFKLQDYALEEARVDDDMGWLDVTYTSTLVRFPTAPPRETEITEKWHRVDAEWYPVPPDRVELYPVSPEHRDAEQEAALRSRFDRSWTLRREGDTDALYQMIDPDDRAMVDPTDFAEGEAFHDYVDIEVHWVEAIADRGRVNVTITYKLKDPSMTKLPPQQRRLTEQWILRDGQWYRDLAEDRSRE